MSFDRYVLNPDYGTGCYRRRILLHAEQGRVDCELEDCNHGFKVSIEHDGNQVTAVNASTLRIPMSTCPGAVEPLRKMVGVPLDSSPMSILKAVNIRSNCTHLYDLSVLGIAQAHRVNTMGLPRQRQYDIAVHDQPAPDEPAIAEVYRDGELIHCWHVHDSKIRQPEALLGNSVMQGFTFWANRIFSGDDNEAAFALQKGIFVASARVYDMNKVADEPATAHPFMRDVCYSYSSPQWEQAVRLPDSVRDFTDTTDQLLKFL